MLGGSRNVWPWLAGALLLPGCTPTTDEWLRDLQASEPFERLLAVTALRWSAAADLARVVPALLWALADTDAAVRERAQESLDLLAPAAENVLAGLVTAEPDDRLRAAAVGQLARRGSVSALSAALDDSRAPDRTAIAIGLGSIGTAAIAPLLAHAQRGDAGALARAIIGLDAVGPPARAHIAPLVRRVFDTGDDVALRAVCTRSDTALLTLFQERQACSPQRRAALLAVLVEALVLSVAEHRRSQEAAALALQQLDVEAVPHLLTLCDDARDEVQSWATMALVAIGERARPQLEAFAGDPASTRGEAARRVLARWR